MKKKKKKKKKKKRIFIIYLISIKIIYLIIKKQATLRNVWLRNALDLLNIFYF